MRVGEWKFLCEFDGSEPELYDMLGDRGETKNLAAKHPEIVARLSRSVIAWHKSMPPDKGPDFVRKAKRKP